MSNPYKAQRDVTLNGIAYQLCVDMHVIAQWQDKTGKCLVNSALRATAAYAQARRMKSALDREIVLTNEISLNDAAWLFYLAAKRGNSQVEFGEMQEAMIDDMDLTSNRAFYAAMYVDLTMFVLNGPPDKDDKKKEPASSSGSTSHQKPRKKSTSKNG